MGKPNKTPSVVVLTSVIPPRLHHMLGSVIKYAQEHGPWRLYLVERRLWSYNFNNWERWGADAIISADHHSVEEARRIVAAKLPTVVLLQPHQMRQKGYPLRKFSCCVWDSNAIGQMAARHFLDRGYANFAFVDDPNVETYWSKDRERAFRQELRKSSEVQPHYHRYGGATPREREDWMNERPHLANWLQGLPKPCAVFAPNDRRGKQVLDACAEAGISVPGELAVLGVDDDPWFCEASVPTLSSIHCDVESAGYAIAEHLDRILGGEKPKRIEVLVRPTGITVRQSTEWSAVSDGKVAAALAYIQKNINNPSLAVPAIAQSVGLARRTIENRFRAATGKTLLEEIEHVRLSHAQELLRQGGRKISEIATLCGYSSGIYFSNAFARRFGVSPKLYQQQWLHGTD